MVVATILPKYKILRGLTIALDLCKRQYAYRAEDVMLPPWAATAEEFIEKHREALV